MLTEVGDGVWVRQSAWVWSNSIVVRGDGGLILIDPGIDGAELEQLADDLEGLRIPVIAGFSTHPHWDHLLWHPRFGDVPRYATAAAAAVTASSETRERGQGMAAESTRRTLSATPRCFSQTVASCSRVTCCPMPWFRSRTLAAPILLASMRRH